MANTHNLLKLYLLILTTVFLTQYNFSESSFAQNSNGIFGLKTSSLENSEKTTIKPALMTQKTAAPETATAVTQKTAAPETATAVPDVTSNISLIITPDIVNPLANEDPSSSNAMSKILTVGNTTTNDIKDNESTSGNQNNNNNTNDSDVITPSNTNDSDVITPSNTNDSDVITPSNTNIADSGNDVITTPTAAAANNATSSQGNSSGTSAATTAAAAAANNATSSQGNSSGTSAATTAAAAAANNASQITSNLSQGANNNNTTNKSINSSANSEAQTSSPPAFPWFDEFFKFFGAK